MGASHQQSPAGSTSTGCGSSHWEGVLGVEVSPFRDASLLRHELWLRALLSTHQLSLSEHPCFCGRECNFCANPQSVWRGCSDRRISWHSKKWSSLLFPVRWVFVFFFCCGQIWKKKAVSWPFFLPCLVYKDLCTKVCSVQGPLQQGELGTRTAVSSPFCSRQCWKKMKFIVCSLREPVCLSATHQYLSVWEI